VDIILCNLLLQKQQAQKEIKLNLQLGDIYYANLPVRDGSAQYGIRPCIIAQESKVLRNTDMVWVIPLTSRLKSLHLPMHVVILKDKINNLKYDSMALVESMVYIPKHCLGNKIGRIDDAYFSLIGSATVKQYPMCEYAMAMAI
jgi:mRNA interferase MazF